MRKMPIALAAGLAIVSGLFASPALAEARPTGNETITAVLVGGPDGDHIRVVAHGAINGAGEDIPGESLPTDPPNLDRDTVVLRGGTMSLLSTFDDESQTLDPRSCVGTLDLRGHFEIVGGTGEFVGTTATGTFTGRGVLVLRRGPSGCIEDGPPQRLVIRFRFVGSVR